jgi:acyl-CoA synthetase (AMP-forming)/AMP-acid ligase II
LTGGSQGNRAHGLRLVQGINADEAGLRAISSWESVQSTIEIWIKSPWIMAGYWRLPEAAAHVLFDGSTHG